MKNSLRIKQRIAKVFHFIQADRVLAASLDRFHGRGYIRAINYHDLTGAANGFEQQLKYLADRFDNVSLKDLELFFANGAWHKPKPGLILSFDDGLRSHYEVAAPLLKKYAFTGWFFIPTDFIVCPPRLQQQFAKEHHIAASAVTDGNRLAMSWEEILALSERGHVIASHTRSHHRTLIGDTEEVLRREIAESKALLETMIGRSVEVFGWVGGEERVYHARAASEVRRAGYKYAFMTNCALLFPYSSPLHIQRTNIEAAWSLELVSFQLSGAMDFYYLPKRIRTENRTRV
jgi:peptidoglycan/xylan/chitin deacetylase (PgdA/CDA1 family)